LFVFSPQSLVLLILTLPLVIFLAFKILMNRRETQK
jgi:hypothetical protein